MNPSAGPDTTPTELPTVMAAWTQHRYGEPSILELADVAVPTVGDDEVLVRVASTSINAADRYNSNPSFVMRPLIGKLRGPNDPIGGLDVAGTVVSIGSGVEGFAVGDRVFGEAGGGFGGFTTARVDRIATVPDAMSLRDAGGVPVAALTALQGFRDHAQLQPGMRVLINGASGGVGTFAVQIAKAKGAHVTAVCSTSKLDTALELGADAVLDYTQVDVIDHLVTRGEKFDILFDVAGVHSTRQRAKLLTADGCCLFVGGPSGGSVFGPLLGFARSFISSKFVSGRFVMFVARSDGDDMAELAEMIAAGKVRTVVEDVVPFERLPDALVRFQRGHLAGKIIIEH